MAIYIKKGNGFKCLGEGTICPKKYLKLREGVDANLGTTNGIQQAQAKAKQIMNKNPNVQSASADAGKLDGAQDKSTGEGMSLDIPVDANGQQLASAQRMAHSQGNNDVQIKFTKNDASSSGQTQENKSSRRLTELRQNSIGFTKQELSEFLNSI